MSGPPKVKSNGKSPICNGYLLGGKVIPYEQRFRAGMLCVVGFFRGVLESPIERADLVRRIKIPILMLNGRLDAWIAIETQVKPLFDMLGASAADKRLAVYESSHWPYPHNEVIKENLAWLDRYLGPVKGER